MYHQSINQSFNYISCANIVGKARLSDATTKSVFNSKIEEFHNINVPSGVPVSIGGRPSQRSKILFLNNQLKVFTRAAIEK